MRTQQISVDKEVIYCFSGLGADHRVFSFLKSDKFHLCVVPWLTPDANESLQSYAHRMGRDIPEHAILMGVSFGGMIAQEVAMQRNAKKLILLSTIKSTTEFSTALTFVKELKMYAWLPNWLNMFLNKISADYYFSTENKMESQLLAEIIRDTDAAFSGWAIAALMNWRGGIYSGNLLRLHGTRDRIFPIDNIKEADYLEGGHFMIVNRAPIVIRKIETFLE